MQSHRALGSIPYFFSVWLHKLRRDYIVMLLKWLEGKGQRGVPISVDVTVSEGGGGGGGGRGSGMCLWLDTGTSLSSHPVSQWFTNSRWFASENRFQHRFSYVYTRMMHQRASWKPVHGEQMSAASTVRSWSWSGWDPILWKAKKCANMIPPLCAGSREQNNAVWIFVIQLLTLFISRFPHIVGTSVMYLIK